MELWDHNRFAFSTFAALAVLSGCNGGTSSTVTPQSGGVAARHACPQIGGKATCSAMIESRSSFSAAVVGWAPADIQARYKLPSSSKGAGQIVAMVDAYDNPNVASDLATYRSEFGLGAAKLTKYNQKGQTKDYPQPNGSWGVEIDVDVEMVSASCPLCTIYLVEASSSDSSDLQTAEKEAVKLGAHIVSNSWVCVGSSSCVSESYFDTPGVEYLASSGDSGSGQFAVPASFEHVAAIGGTVLLKSGSKYSESVWTDGGGGCDTNVPKPPWQHDTFCSGRAVNDASAVAVNVAAYDSYEFGGWFQVDGTAVPTPLLAGVFGLAGNASNQDGGRTFWQKKHRKDLYNVCATSGCLFKQYSYGGGWGSPDGIGAF